MAGVSMGKKKIPKQSEVFVIGEFAEIINPLNKNYGKIGIVTSITPGENEATIKGYWWDNTLHQVYHSHETYRFEEVETNELTNKNKKKIR